MSLCDLALQTFPLREIFSVVCYIGMNFFDWVLVPIIGLMVNRILPDKAKRLLELNTKDHAFIIFNRLCTCLFLYHLIKLSCSGYFVQEVSSWTTPKGIATNLGIFCIYFPASILIFDFFYATMHRALHVEWLYPLIHKHHHLQYTPFRGQVDAINVHPIEYILGEYTHILANVIMAQICQKYFNYTPHAFFTLIYIVIAGTMSTLNHTRIDVRIPYIYCVWWHDLHHRVPPTNYGQYTMFWDWVFGWYKEESTKSTVDDFHKQLFGDEPEEEKRMRNVTGAATGAVTGADDIARMSAVASARASKNLSSGSPRSSKAIAIAAATPSRRSSSKSKRTSSKTPRAASASKSPRASSAKKKKLS